MQRDLIGIEDAEIGCFLRHNLDDRIEDDGIIDLLVFFAAEVHCRELQFF